MAYVERDRILELYGYHHWATDRVFQGFADVTTLQLADAWGGSFGSGRALLRHVVGVERLWCERWTGESPPALPDYPRTWAGRDYAEEWRAIRGEQMRFLEEVSRDRLAGELSYVNVKGERWTYPLTDVLVHVVNHGTYHRGQLTHLLRDLGRPGIATDYLMYCDAMRQRSR